MSGNFVSISSGAGVGTGTSGGHGNGSGGAAALAEDKDRINEERRHAGKGHWWKRKGKKGGVAAPEIGEMDDEIGRGGGIVR